MKSDRLTPEACRAYIAENLFSPPKNAIVADRIGMELETFPFYRKDEVPPKPLSILGLDTVLAAGLVHLASEVGAKVQYFQADGLRTALARIDFPDGSNFQFEPGGQLEIVTSPCFSLKELHQQLVAKQKLLDQIAPGEIFFAQVGTQPWFGLDEIDLQLRKPRYRALQGYLEKIGPFGLQMMRQTCSLQLNLDLGPTEEIQLKRTLLAQLISPLANAIFANSPTLEGKSTGKKSYRNHIWQHVDPRRSGLLPLAKMTQSLSKEALVEAYFQLALHAPLIYLEELGAEVLPSEMTLAYALKNPIKGLEFNLSHLKNHLSLLFPDVRMRGFIEVRALDCLSRDWQMVPAIFYRRLFYHEPLLSHALDLLLPLANELDAISKEAAFGLESDRVFRYALLLFELALEVEGESVEEVQEGVSCQELLQSYFDRFTKNRQTPADYPQSLF